MAECEKTYDIASQIANRILEWEKPHEVREWEGLMVSLIECMEIDHALTRRMLQQALGNWRADHGWCHGCGTDLNGHFFDGYCPECGVYL